MFEDINSIQRVGFLR